MKKFEALLNSVVEADKRDQEAKKEASEAARAAYFAAYRAADASISGSVKITLPNGGWISVFRGGAVITSSSRAVCAAEVLMNKDVGRFFAAAVAAAEKDELQISIPAFS
ncbi:MAG TPA: hypothetical protein PLN18_00040 [Candidatus Colwellbacteria bacterium]|nr:hypothetical protein [Candidatus Colwellbacteria bacterium]HQA95750.1 hypothetical protein [Candidatus Colwellbacteria bacterium]